MEQQNMVLECIQHGVNRYKSLLRATGFSKKELQVRLDALMEEEKILYDIQHDEYYPIKKAKLTVKEAGYAFACVEGEEADYYIAQEDLGSAYNGDTVLIYPFEKGVRLMNAKVLRILEHANTYVVGSLNVRKTKKGNRYFITSTMKDFPVKVNVREDMLMNAKVGSIVTADIMYAGTAINGKITHVLGYPDDPGIEISQIAAEFGFKTPFPNEVVKEIEDIPDKVLEQQKKGRRDFTDKSIITIDGDDSKDFDDAVYASRLDNGNYLLEVYIADVAEYVLEGMPLDIEAFSRGTSVYLADRVIPMLPRKLSNGICSLNEGVERLVLACLMEIDTKGNLVNYDICEGFIQSRHRMTYSDVNLILNGNSELCEKYADIVDMLYLMQELSHIIRQRRYKKGGLEFEVDEYKITLNTDGSPKDITLRIREDAERLIEDFMLQANETVAYHMSIMNLPCVYRVHEKPDQDKLHTVFGLISNMGVSLKNTKNEIHSKQIQDALTKIKDSSFSPIIHQMLLRSMMKAKYYEKCLGHYGLAMQYYCHFTSPIRRYPDLMTHRILKRVLLHPQKYTEDILHFETILPEVCLKTSASERRAIDCEREVNDMLYAWYMSRHIRQEYCGIITSLTSFGMFVSLDNGVEGLISYRDMDGYFDYDENTMSAVSAERKYKLGDKVNIVVVSADKEKRRIDFMLKEDYIKYNGDDKDESDMF